MKDEAEQKAGHCKDCCCARSWRALGVTEYTGKSIPEHIDELKAERDDAIAEMKLEHNCQVAQLKAEIEQIKTVEFPRKVEAVARDNYVRGLERALTIMQTEPHFPLQGIRAEIDKAKAGKG